MLIDIIRSFLPWILYFVFLGQTQAQLNTAIITAAIACIILEFKGLRKGFILNWGTLAFFLFMLITVVLFKNQWVGKHAWIFSNGSLAIIAWISILVRQPFTIQYAKLQVPKDKWDHPIFLKINYILTSTWGMIFVFSLAVHLLRFYYPQMNNWIYELLSDGASVLGILFTTWFPNWYQEKYIKSHAPKKTSAT